MRVIDNSSVYTSVSFFAWGANTGIAVASSTRYLYPGTNPSGGASSSRQSIVVPSDCLIDRLHYRANGGGSAGNFDLKLFVDNVASALAVSLANTATTGNNTSAVVSVAAGSTIEMAQIADAGLIGGAGIVYVTCRIRAKP